MCFFLGFDFFENDEICWWPNRTQLQTMYTLEIIETEETELSVNQAGIGLLLTLVHKFCSPYPSAPRV
jgi:hypothetical protein